MAIKQGVRVNAVAPGPVWTPLIRSTMPKEQVKTFGGDTPLGRPAQPVELAPVFVFLASNDARYVTGEVYAATGGHVLTADESRALAPLQEPSAFEYGGHRLFDSRRSGRRLLGRGKVIQVTALSPRRQCLEGALETRLPPKPLA